MMATQNTRQTVFMFGRLDVLSHAAGWFAKQFETTTSITLVDPEYPRTIFVTPASTRLIQSLRESISALEYVLVAANTPCYFQLDGSHLSYTELGSELMDSDDIETSAGRLKRTLDLMKVIVQHVEMYPA